MHGQIILPSIDLCISAKSRNGLTSLIYLAVLQGIPIHDLSMYKIVPKHQSQLMTQSFLYSYKNNGINSTW